MPARRLTSPSRHLRLGAAIALSALLAACDRQGAAPANGEPDAAAAAPAGEAPAAVPAPETPEGKVSYSAAFQVVAQFAGQVGEDFDADAFRQGVEDALAGREPRVDRAAFAAARGELLERRRARTDQEASQNVAAAQSFLAENASRPEVTTTASGLQYEVMKEGDGPAPASATATVVTHYTGRLLDGTVFDSSEARGEPATFGLDQVIPGWTEALQLMQVGDRWKIWLPPELAYGARPPSPDIPPNALLEFEVELIEVPSGES